ncbi:MFS transporter [Rhizobiaceae sp. 2RAB30]
MVTQPVTAHQQKSLLDAHTSFGLLLLLLAAILALRVAGLAVSHAELFFDEAQYWAWAQDPAFGYYTKPPLIAWQIAASTSLCGDSPACIRLSSPLIHFATSLLLYAVAFRLFDRRVAFWSALVYAAMPGTSISATLISTDVALLFFWTLGLLAIVLHVQRPSLAAGALLGLAVGGFWALAVSAAARMVSEEKMGVAIAVILAGISVGTVVGVPAGALVGELVGWRWAFAINAGFALAILLAQLVFLPRLPATKSVRLGDMLGLFRRRDVLLGLAATALLVTGHFAAYTYVTPLLVDVSGFAMAEVTLLLAAYGVAAFAGNFIAGKVVAKHTRATLVGVSLLVAATTIAVPNIAAVPALSIALLILWGAAFGGLPVALQTWMYKASGEEKESGQVVFNSLFQWALALGALFGGLVVDGLGVAPAIMLGGGLALVAAAVVWLVAKDDGGETSEVPAAI